MKECPKTNLNGQNQAILIATIETVMDYGAYANLDEFHRRGFLHISEISSARIRNVRDFVRESQKMVLKVLRVDVEKGHIDLSLRRVTKRERIEKIKSWKKERKGDALLKAVADKLGLPLQQMYQTVGAPLEEKIGLYEGFEKTVKEPRVPHQNGHPRRYHQGHRTSCRGTHKN